MALPSPQHSNRQWFVDRRAPDRRMQVTWHREERTAVLSLWHRDTCTATFQLPPEAAARLIAHLADGLAAVASGTDISRPSDETQRGRSFRTRLRDLWQQWSQNRSRKPRS